MIKSLAEQVYEQVVKMIQTGELKEGDKVGELFLVERIGISRTPIREALIQLASDNILENVPRKGFYVKGINRAAMDNVYELVALIDVYAAEKGWDKIDDEAVAQMEECVEKMDLALKLRVYEVYEEWQRKFHEVYRTALGNEEINDTIEYLLKKVISSSFLLGEEEELFKASGLYNEQHKNLIACIKAGDLEGFKKQLRKHWMG